VGGLLRVATIELSEIQRRVLEARLRGVDLRSVARELGMALSTVWEHDRRTWAKLGFHPPRRLRNERV
jgi:DNA-binding NarL/FixJ family response regulator